MGLQLVLRGDWISACWRWGPSVCQLVLVPQNSTTLFQSLSYSLEFCYALLSRRWLRAAEPCPHSLSRVRLFDIPWTVVLQLLCPWDFQARVLQWVAIFFSRGSSRPRGQTCVSYTGRQVLYHWASDPTKNYALIYEYHLQYTNNLIILHTLIQQFHFHDLRKQLEIRNIYEKL